LLNGIFEPVFLSEKVFIKIKEKINIIVKPYDPSLHSDLKYYVSNGNTVRHECIVHYFKMKNIID
jgi:hypothetical protein